MDLKGIGALGGLAVLVSMGVAAYRISEKIDERHIDSLIRAGSTVIVVIVLGAFAILATLSYLRARARDRAAYGAPQRRPEIYQPPSLPHHNPPGIEDHGTFVMRENGRYAHPPEEDWR